MRKSTDYAPVNLWQCSYTTGIVVADAMVQSAKVRQSSPAFNRIGVIMLPFFLQAGPCVGDVPAYADDRATAYSLRASMSMTSRSLDGQSSRCSDDAAVFLRQVRPIQNRQPGIRSSCRFPYPKSSVIKLASYRLDFLQSVQFKVEWPATGCFHTWAAGAGHFIRHFSVIVCS